MGAVPGALPAVIGWAAARGDVSLGGWTLFAIVFLWQMPHFLAIAWMHRDQYRGAGLVMLKRDDHTGLPTAATSFVFTLLLTAATLVPFDAGTAGGAYLGGGRFNRGSGARIDHQIHTVFCQRHRTRLAKTLACCADDGFLTRDSQIHD